MSPSSESAGRAEKQFQQLMGPGRGVTDLTAVRAKLAVAERELVAANHDVHVLTTRNELLEERTFVLNDRVSELEESLMLVRCSLTYRDFELDGARYDLVRAGLPDVVFTDLDNGFLFAHQGVWTKGRPYLGGQAVWEPGTEDCYLVSDDGAPCGRRPSRSRCWEPLDPGANLPLPEPIHAGSHPASSGQAVRQTARWVDKHHDSWSLQDLSREHLLGVIDWLADNAFSLWTQERREARVLVPCPVNAYPTAEAWMHDTPLFGALLAEKTRRHIRRSPAITKEPRPADAHPY